MMNLLSNKEDDPIIGVKYNMLTVLRQVAPYINPNSKVKYKRYLFLCDCGKTTEAKLSSVKYGTPKSCGCLQRKSVGHNLRKHGDYKTRLYQCWQNMNARARSRKNCEVCSEWRTFPPFKKWALGNGYRDDLVLCRNGDKGDYEPNNVRWDSRRNNNLEAISLRGSNLLNN